MWFTVDRSFQQARAEGELLNFLLRCTPSFSALFEAVSLQIRGTTSNRYERAPRRPCSGGRAEGRRNGGPRLDGASFVGPWGRLVLFPCPPLGVAGCMGWQGTSRESGWICDHPIDGSFNSPCVCTSCENLLYAVGHGLGAGLEYLIVCCRKYSTVCLWIGFSSELLC